MARRSNKASRRRRGKRKAELMADPAKVARMDAHKASSPIARVAAKAYSAKAYVPWMNARPEPKRPKLHKRWADK